MDSNGHVTNEEITGRAERLRPPLIQSDRYPIGIGCAGPRNGDQDTAPGRLTGDVEQQLHWPSPHGDGPISSAGDGAVRCDSLDLKLVLSIQHAIQVDAAVHCLFNDRSTTESN